MADRSLARLREKLNGKNENALSYSSVDGQVDCLITQATNPDFLCRLFPGWQPYL
jgi:serine-protein kinase ATM